MSDDFRSEERMTVSLGTSGDPELEAMEGIRSLFEWLKLDTAARLRVLSYHMARAQVDEDRS